MISLVPKEDFKLVVIESPFAATPDHSVESNIQFARACVKDCLDRGESAYASHLFFTQEGILDDTIPEERNLGIRAGFAWRKMTEATVVYLDRGVTDGMWKGILHAQSLKGEGHELDFRYLDPLLEPRLPTGRDVTRVVTPRMGTPIRTAVTDIAQMGGEIVSSGKGPLVVAASKEVMDQIQAAPWCAKVEDPNPLQMNDDQDNWGKWSIVVKGDPRDGVRSLVTMGFKVETVLDDAMVVVGQRWLLERLPWVQECGPLGQ